MAFEPGTNSYITQAQADLWLGDRPRLNAGWALLSQAEKEGALVAATDYLEAKYQGLWRGYRLNTAQPLNWPRNGMMDNEGRLLANIPSPLIAAVSILAHKSGVDQQELAPDVTKADKAKKKKTGPVETEFSEGASSLTDFTQVERLLAPLLDQPKGKVRRS
ncbi:MAG: hypothetical protein RRB13_02690 [bacterium]|nr:hypothetical protein [bacterium]